MSVSFLVPIVWFVVLLGLMDRIPPPADRGSCFQQPSDPAGVETDLSSLPVEFQSLRFDAFVVLSCLPCVVCAYLVTVCVSLGSLCSCDVCAVGVAWQCVSRFPCQLVGVPCARLV